MSSSEDQSIPANSGMVSFVIFPLSFQEFGKRYNSWKSTDGAELVYGLLLAYSKHLSNAFLHHRGYTRRKGDGQWAIEYSPFLALLLLQLPWLVAGTVASNQTLVYSLKSLNYF